MPRSPQMRESITLKEIKSFLNEHEEKSSLAKYETIVNNAIKKGKIDEVTNEYYVILLSGLADTSLGSKKLALIESKLPHLSRENVNYGYLGPNGLNIAKYVKSPLSKTAGPLTKLKGLYNYLNTPMDFTQFIKKSPKSRKTASPRRSSKTRKSVKTML
ncbi:MAG: hypothetical protein F2563_03795 [Actinobacteria bacterium]|uniref:Unannotated protein n=1 Tax=freshwater metagenome TaxID=449393 RepID=A0A6J6F0X7_9ZZZZ|nr:hypothetical protein [Actinomycetota bacterium]